MTKKTIEEIENEVDNELNKDKEIVVKKKRVYKKRVKKDTKSNSSKDIKEVKSAEIINDNTMNSVKKRTIDEDTLKKEKILNQSLDDLKSSKTLKAVAEKYSDYQLYLDKKITLEQCAFLAVYERNLANIANALKNINIGSRQTYYSWIKKNEIFKQACEDLKEERIDIVESKLQENILKGNVIAQLFYLKTIGRKRGYQETLETNNKIEVIDFDFEEVKQEEE